MNSAQLAQIIGEELETAIVQDKYGDAAIHAHGYITGDPCYILDDAGYREYLDARDQQFPSPHTSIPGNQLSPDQRREVSAHYKQLHSQWNTLYIRGIQIYFRDTNGDGFHFGHNIDSGQVAAIPLPLVPEIVRSRLIGEVVYEVERL